MAFGYKVYFTERSKNRVIRWDPDSGIAQIVAGSAGVNEPSQTLQDPYGLAFGPDGSLIVSDKLNHRICRLRQGRLESLPLRDANGHRAPRPDSPAYFQPGQLLCPSSLFLEKAGTLLCTFFDDQTLYRIHPDGRLELVLGVVMNRPYLQNPTREYVPPGEIPEHPLFGPTGVVARSDGTIFFIERHRQVVREYHPARGLRSVFSIAQAAEWSQKTEAPAQGRLDGYHPVSPTSLALDGNEALYVCDPYHSSILKIDLEHQTFERVIFLPRGPSSCLDGGPLAVTFAPNRTAWVADSASMSIRSYSLTAQGTWAAAAPKLETIQNEPLWLIGGGMGLLVGP